MIFRGGPDIEADATQQLPQRTKKNGRRGKRQHEEERVFARRARIEEQFENGFSLQVRKNARILSRFLSQFVCATARLFFPNFQSSRRLSLSLSLSLSTRAKYPTTCSLPLLSLFPSRRGFSFSLARSIFSDVEMCAPHRASEGNKNGFFDNVMRFLTSLSSRRERHPLSTHLKMTFFSHVIILKKLNTRKTDSKTSDTE